MIIIKKEDILFSDYSSRKYYNCVKYNKDTDK